MTPTASAAAILAVAIIATGCAIKPADFARQPQMSPLGSGLQNGQVVLPVPMEPPAPRPSRPGFSSWSDSGADLFRDARAMRVGDVITVKISIKDKASIDNSSNRSREGTIGLGQSMSYGLNTDHYAAKGDGAAHPSASAANARRRNGVVSRSKAAGYARDGEGMETILRLERTYARRAHGCTRSARRGT